MIFTLCGGNGYSIDCLICVKVFQKPFVPHVQQKWKIRTNRAVAICTGNKVTKSFVVFSEIMSQYSRFFQAFNHCIYGLVS